MTLISTGDARQNNYGRRQALWKNLTDNLKKVILAGIGAVATTAEKSKDVLDDMVKKGELTVEQGQGSE